MKYTGRSLPRLDVTALVTGAARFAGDVSFVDALHVRFVRSPVAHGEIRSIDTSAALSHPDVVAVWTAKDLNIPPLPYRVGPSETLDPFRQPALAGPRVRFVGEAVAAVFATNPAVAIDMAEKVIVDVVAAEPSLDPRGTGGRSGDEPHAKDAAVVRKAFGDLHQAFDEAAHVVQSTVSLARDSSNIMTPRACAAQFDPGSGQLDLWTAARDRAFWRGAVARTLGLTLGQVRLAAPALGADYGVQADMAPEEFVVAAAAQRMGRGVRWEEDLLEHSLAAPQGRGCTATVRAALGADGVPRAFDLEFWLDQGAYLRPDGLQRAELIGALVPGIIALDAYRAIGHVRLTHKVPAGTLRGGGAVEAAFITERTLSASAAAAGMGLEDLKRATVTGDEEDASAPASLTLLGKPFALDSANVRKLIRSAETRFDFPLMRKRAKSWRGPHQVAGFGTAAFADVSGLGHGERVRVSIDPSGTVDITLNNGASPAGATALRQIAADILGVDYSAVAVRLEERADTRCSDMAGVTAIAGVAVMEAAEALRERVLDKAAEMAGMERTRVTIRSGRIREADRHFGGNLELAALATACHDAGDLLMAEAQAAADGALTPTGYCGALIAIDVTTGVISVPKLFIAVECGNAINPEEIRRQLADGAMMGLSSALYTQRQVGPTGDPIGISAHDHAAPSLGEMPEVEVLIADDEPSPLTPLGAKGVGRLGVIGVGPAIAAGVDAALGVPGFASQLPITPSAVRALLRERIATAR